MGSRYFFLALIIPKIKWGQLLVQSDLHEYQFLHGPEGDLNSKVVLVVSVRTLPSE